MSTLDVSDAATMVYPESLDAHEPTLKNPFHVALTRPRSHTVPPVLSLFPKPEQSLPTISFHNMAVARSATEPRRTRDLEGLPAVAQHLQQVRSETLALKDLCVRFRVTSRRAMVISEASEPARRALDIISDLASAIMDDILTAIYSRSRPRWSDPGRGSMQPLARPQQSSLWGILARSRSHVDLCNLRRAVAIHRTTLHLLIDALERSSLAQLEAVSNYLAAHLAALHVDSGAGLSDTLDELDRQIILLTDGCAPPNPNPEPQPVICASPLSYSAAPSPVPTARHHGGHSPTSSISSSASSASTISTPPAPTTPTAPALFYSSSPESAASSVAASPNYLGPFAFELPADDAFAVPAPPKLPPPPVAATAAECPARCPPRVPPRDPRRQQLGGTVVARDFATGGEEERVWMEGPGLGPGPKRGSGLVRRREVVRRKPVAIRGSGPGARQGYHCAVREPQKEWT